METFLHHPVTYALIHSAMLLPLLYFRALPLQSRLQPRERKILLFSGLGLILLNAAVLMWLFRGHEHLDSETAVRIFKWDIMLYYTVATLPFLLIVRRFLYEHIFIHGTIGLFWLMTISIALFIVNRIPFVHGIYKLELVCALILVLNLAIYPFLRSTLRRTVTPFLGTANKPYWSRVCLIPVAMLLASIFAVPLNVFLSSPLQLLSRLLVTLATIFLCRAIAYDHVLFTQRTQLESQIDAQKEYYRAMAEKMHSDRRARHDFQHQLAAVSAMAQRGETDEIIAYCEQLSALSRGEAIPYTGNAAVDGVLYRYQRRAAEAGVPLKLRGSFKPHSPLEIDLCVVIGNALENALAASASLPPAERFIELELLLEGSLLTLTVRNRFDGILLYDEQRALLSRKRESERGYGMASIQTLCEAHGGTMTIHTEGNIFALMVLMNVEE